MGESLLMDTLAYTDLQELAEACQVSPDDLTDVYYCTPLQRTLLAASEKYSDAYCYRGVWTLGSSVDADRFLDAIATVASQNAILRTRIVDSAKHGLVQVVLRNVEPVTRSFSDLAAYLEHERLRTMGLGTPLTRWALVDRTVALTIHHAAYDLTSIKAMKEDCLRVYHGQDPTPRPPFGLFAERCMNVDESTAEAFWKPRFSQMAAIFPDVDSDHAPRATSNMSHCCRLPSSNKYPVTLLPVIVEGAWAHTSSIYTGQPAVAYGVVFSGRTPQLGALGTTLGPTVATVPVQVDVDPEITIGDLIKGRAKERRQALSNAALQYNMSKIRALGVEAKRASEFQSILNITTTPMFGGSTDEMQLVEESEGTSIYAMILRVLIQDGEILVDVSFDPDVICERQMRRTLHQFDQSIHLLVEGPQDRKLKQLAALSTEDWKEVSSWNASLPQPAQQCLHQTFHDLAQLHPIKTAVEAWDRNVTYGELDTLSTELAHRLVACGIKVGDAVLIHIDRSCRAIVATLAIMKAGGCCVPLAPAHPRARKDTIAAESKARVVIVSDSADGVHGLVEHTIMADEQSYKGRFEQKGLPTVSANDLAYLLFTSGSTGMPKGVMLEHQGMSTALAAIGVSQKLNPNTRSLQFASLVWDVSISDIFGPLTHGGCVCVPCNDERDSDLALYITRKAVTWAQLTPLVLRTLSPSLCPTLQTVQSCGEAIDPSAPQLWKDIHFCNGWGVSEASIQNSVNTVDADCAYPRAIGRPLGCALWIVDPQDAQKLIPIGAIGEIVIEGTTVARGYLNNVAKTAESFIDAPRWAPSRPTERRFYRTGDLARYFPDGNIDLVGRKDDQAKLRGQRFELAEVELTILKCSPVRECAVMVHKFGQHEDLVAIITLANVDLPHHNDLRELKCDEMTRQALDTIQEQVKSKLPAFMLPKHWLLIEKLPQSITAKVDRGALKKWLAERQSRSFDSTAHGTVEGLSAPIGDAEKTLQEVWASVLATPLAQIGRETSFIELGGDSISGMQVASRCRKRGYLTSVAKLLSSTSLAEAASGSEHTEALASLHGALSEGETLLLSPVQRLFLEHAGPASNNHFNQSWLLQFRSTASPDRLKAVLRRLVQHHAALRTVFAIQDDGTWTSKVMAPTDRMLHFQYARRAEVDNPQKVLERTQKSFDISQGPLFGADLIDLSDGRRLLFLAAHHLAVDIVSWNIIFEQIDALLHDPDAELLSTAPFSSWTKHLSNVSPSTATWIWPRADRGFWGMENRLAHAGESVKTELVLDHDTSHLLLNSANDAFKTTPAELLLSAIFMSFWKTFPDRGTPSLYVENHGRPIEQAAIDLTGTVGWCTVLFPIILAHEAPQCPYEDLVPAVKDAYRQASSSAIDSFARTMQGASPLHFRDIEISFNFIGRMQQVDREDGILRFLPDMHHLRGPDYADNAERYSLIAIDAMVLNDRIHIGIDWSRQMARQDQLQGLARKIRQNASELVDRFSKRGTSLTRTEMPLLEHDEPYEVERRLNELGLATDDIEAVHPVSAVQEGILLAQAKSYDNVYMQQVVLKVAPAQKHSMDIERLVQAWASVCRAHSMLRSIFLSSISTVHTFVQLVLRRTSPSFSYIDSAQDGGAIRRFTTREPPHHLQIRKVPDSDDVHLTLYSNHALLDAAAIAILANDLACAYTTSGSLAEGKSFTKYLRWARTRETQSQEYWKTYLAGAKPCRLPTLTSPGPAESLLTSAHVDATFRHADQVHNFCQQSGVTVATFMQVAWAIVLRQFTCSDKIIFGYLCSNRDAFDGAEETVGPLISMLTTRVDVGRHAQISGLLQRVKSDLANGMLHSACSIASIQDSLGLESEALFDTVLSFQHEVPRTTGVSDGTLIHITPIAINDPTEYAIALQVLSSREVIRVRLEYQQKRIPAGFASEILDLLDSVTWSLIQGVHTSSVASIIGDRDVLSTYQRKLIQQWNAEAPQTVEGCLHDRIRHTAARRPDAPAVCFGDYEMDYAKLDSLSDRLAGELHDRQGVGAEQIVPFLCEKGIEAVVFMLAIIKAGAVVLGLDANHPDERIREVLEDADASLLIAQPSLAGRARAISRGTVVSYDLDSIIAPPGASPFVSVDPAQLAYCIYTSGSTGKPKGILVPHSSIVTSLNSALKPFGIDQNTRMFQISSFAFDMSIVEVFQTLLAGGCICMPTEQERMNDIEGAITRMRANFVYTTPSMAEILRPDQVPTLTTLVLMGETITPEAVDRWHGKLRLMACYGPAETAALSSCVDVCRTQISNLGLPFGCRYWVVDEHDHDSLVPIGQLGELLIQGPIVSRGYIKDRKRTAESFIRPPVWTKDFQGLDNLAQPFYKTGDLVIQNADGSVAHIGRKDLQVKLLGQRLELREIESHLRRQHGSDWHFIVELIRPKQPPQSPFLVVFMSCTSKVLTTSCGSNPNQPLGPMPGIARTMHDMLSTTVPSYMVPKIYIPLPALPLNSSCKTDRKQLRAIAGLLTAAEILRYNALNQTGRDTLPSMDAFGYTSDRDRAPFRLNHIGTMLRQLWSQVLSVPQPSVHPHSEWMGLGGNSFKAIQLVSAAREQGLSLTVADIFRNPRLDQLINVTSAVSPGTGTALIRADQAIEPFSLLSVPSSTAREKAARLCGVHVSQIEDMYPCTPLQQALLAVSSRRSGEFVGQVRFLLDSHIAVGRLQRAWGRLVEDTPILRTRVVDIPGQGLTQVVIDEPIAWSSCEAESLEFARDMQLGSLLNKAGIHVALDKLSLIWTAHHAVYDGWSLPLLFEDLERIYFDEQRRPRAHYPAFVRHALNVAHDEDGMTYWREQFAGLNAPQWPLLPSPAYEPRADAKMEYEIRDILAPRRFTLPTAIRAAWAILVSQYTAHSEAVFGVVSSGRQADLAGIERIPGAVLATVPVRIAVDPQLSAENFLQQIQEQATAMTKWEQTGLSNIQLCSPEAKLACGFQSLLLIQPAEQLARDLVRGSRLFSKAEIIETTNGDHRNTSTGVTVFLECEQLDGNLRLLFDFDSNVIKKQAVSRIAQQFEGILRRLCDHSEALSDRRMSGIACATDQDLADIWKWNASVPKSVETCVHHILKPVFARRSVYTAIDAWDGRLTYGQLDVLAEKLSQRLIQLGIRPNTHVPLFFEKSMWSPVAAMAVMKAGGACVMLDVSQPADRIKSITDQTRPALALTSSKQVSFAREITDVPLMVVDQSHIDDMLLEGEVGTFESVRPCDTLYVAFTSGSTGRPKGIVISHANFSSALHHRAQAIGLTETSRTLNVSSYAWDMSWYDLLHTLYAGGCLCIPNDDWKNDLSEAIMRFEANFIATTPTIANFLKASALEALDGIELGGEKPSTELLARIEHSGARYRNIYGPTECTVVGTGSYELRNPSHIGVGVGLVPWIVDPTTRKPAPVGCVGELWLEGPLVGQEYLNDEAQSAEVFIEAPDWLRNGSAACKGRQSKMYRTGDLVRYEPDGSLCLVGRSDGQIKIRGQRLELAEVEHHVKRHLSVVPDLDASIIVEPVVNHETGIAALTALISPSNCEEAELETAVGLLVSGINDRLLASLPSYMIPTAYKSLAEIPLTQTGKTDRGRLRELAASLPNIETTNQSDAIVAPASEGESALRDVCADVLTVCQDSISVTADWLQLGGDSITAMQAVSRARQKDLNLTMELLIRGGTLREIAACLDSSPSQLAEDATTSIRSHGLTPRKNDYFDLSPVQQWYFANHSARIPLDVPVYLKMKREVNPTTLRRAVELVISRHAMLRARFVEDPATKTWKQFIVPDLPSSYELQTHHYVEEEEIPALIRQSRERINAEKGPLMVVNFFNHPDSSQSLFFSTHHLGSDFMSWRIIANELQDVLSGRRLPPVRASEYRDWINALKDFAERNLHPDVAMPNHSELGAPQVDYWNLSPDVLKTTPSIDELGLVLGRSTSAKLLKLGRKTHHVSLHELLLASLIYSFGQAFPDRETLPACHCAGHGRDSFDNNIDVGQTVGWFTATIPVQLAKQTSRSADLVTIIKATKAAARSLPYKGWAYMPSRYFHPAGKEMLDAALPELFLNFTGTSLQQLEASDSLFSFLETPEASQPQGAEQIAPLGIFTFFGHVREGQLHFLSKCIVGRENNRALVKSFERTLLEVSSLSVADIS